MQCSLQAWSEGASYSDISEHPKWVQIRERERADKTEEEENINLAPICKHWSWAGETGSCARHTLLIAVILLSKNLWNNLSRIFSFGARRELTVIVFIFLSIRATKVVYEYVNIFICLKQKRKE